MKKFTGKISISRFSGQSSGVSIRIEDDASHSEVIDLEMSIEDFGAAVMGLSYQPCRFEVHADVVGWHHEHKKEIVWIPARNFSMPREVHLAVIRHALAKYMVDGWQARLADAENPHTYRQGHPLPPGAKAGDGHHHEITFFRHVKP